ncbi:MAG: hypothetical protein N2745_04675 [Syntrophorhabdaceae bacterium]|nr:hypothetical protein [Syntrophorhabdaceae bacterium]
MDKVTFKTGKAKNKNGESSMEDRKRKIYEERERRIRDTIELRRPDRLPVVLRFGFFPARYAGITMEEFIYDPEKMWDAVWKTIRDFPCDMVQDPYFRLIGPLMDILDTTQIKWPGRHLKPDISYQFVEGEYMLPEEYPEFLSDPSDFIIRKYWPRIFNALKGLNKLSPLHGMTGYASGVVGFLSSLMDPDVLEGLAVLKKAGEEALKVVSYRKKFIEEAKREGFPLDAIAITNAPFDKLGDYFRGTKGIMLDMYRRPDLLIMACERLLPFMIERGVEGAKKSGNPFVFIPLHKGAGNYMSLKQFLKFYWPTLHRLMLALIDEGLIPCPFFEGDYNSRLEIIKEIPKGKACYAFEVVDMKLAKKILGGTVCLRGNIPASLLATGTPEAVRDYCMRLIDLFGDEGGLIIDTGGGLDDAKIENVRAIFEAVGIS